MRPVLSLANAASSTWRRVVFGRESKMTSSRNTKREQIDTPGGEFGHEAS